MYVLCVLLSHNESQTLAYPLRPRSLRSFRRITLRSGDVRERRTCARERASDDDEEKMTTMTTVASVVARRGADRATTTRRRNAARGRRVLARAEGTKEETSLHYLVDFAPKNALAVDTAFKLVVLRTSVRGVIRHEIVEKTFTNRYALSGIEQIGEVKRKSILEAVFDAANASAADAASKKRGAYEAIDRVSEEEFYAFYDWQNLKLCENDCRDFARAYLEYLLDDSR